MEKKDLMPERGSGEWPMEKSLAEEVWPSGRKKIGFAKICKLKEELIHHDDFVVKWAGVVASISYDPSMYEVNEESIEDLGKRVFAICPNVFVSSDLSFIGIIKLVVNRYMVPEGDKRVEKVLEEVITVLSACRVKE